MPTAIEIFEQFADTDELMTRPANLAVKFVGDPTEGRVGGYLVVWGSPAQKDLQGEYFTPETDLRLNWYDQRPVLYHHGLDSDLKAEEIGVIISLKADNTGVWAEAQLDMRNKYVRRVLQLIEQGVIGWSSGSIPHLVEVATDGRIKRWPIVEGSLTPTPAEPRRTTVSAIKSALVSAAKEPQAEEPSRSESAQPDHSQATRTKAMDLKQILIMLLTALQQAKPEVAVTPEEADALIANVEQQMAGTETATMSAPEVVAVAQPMVGKAYTELISKKVAADQAVKNAVKTSTEAFIKAQKPNGALPQHTGNGGNGNGHTAQLDVRPNALIQMRTKYADLSAQDMSFLAMLDNFNRGSRGKHTNLKPLISEADYSAFVRETASKAEEQATKRTISLDEPAVKSINGLKANELDHSTQANFGDEWVPDLWSGDLWRRARLENVVLPLFRSFDMPSNPYELPVEGGDPTVYFVPETTSENQQSLADANSAIPDSKIGSGKVSISAKKLALRVGFSAELTEDSIIPILSLYREQADRAIMDAIDHVLINGDDTNTATGNINSDDADPADTEKFLAFDGLLHSALVEDTSRRLDAGGVAPTLSLIRATRFKMLSAYALRPKDIVYLAGGEVFAKLLNLDEFLTMEKIGNRATILNGMIGEIDGSPVLTSAELALAEADGKKSATPGNNILGRMAAVYRPNWYVGYKRRVVVSVDYLPYYDSYQLTATVRLGFSHFDNDSVGVLYNLGV